MPKQLTAQTATITTAAVEVKTLTVSGKQVTLAVFRQLREEPLIADDGTLNGVPWGAVNYHPDKCSGDGHWHIVWQDGDALRRSRVARELGDGSFWSEAGSKFIDAHVREVLEGRGRYFKGTLPPFDRWGTCALTGEASFAIEVQRDELLADPIQAWKWWREAVADQEERHRPEYMQAHVDQARKRLDKAIEGLSCAPPEPGEVDALFAAYKAEAAREANRREQHRATRRALADLPQLFIAV